MKSPKINSRTILTMFCAIALALSMLPRRVDAKAQPKGVILILIDDIGYGDIDALYPSSLKTPKLDRLHARGVRLTDFHVGTTCSPSRGSIMTGRSVNAGHVWHTICGREILRENEQTMAEVFRANGWKTGIFGKWHLGEGYPFSPRFRGFDVSIIHGGGGVGQGPDYWGNDYYSGVDFDGKPTRADVYMENGKLITADKHCTDYWFERAKQFIKKSVSQDKPFFCYLPTNAAHGPFNAPHGYKKGFDGLIENIDDNMGRLDDFLAREGLMDDVLLIFTCDNGTAGRRHGGLRGAKGSHYDGGHNVPCFWRWKKGGIGGTAAAARNVPYLTSGMDLLPTFMDLFGLTRPAGGRTLHGVSLKKMLLDPKHVPAERTIVVDTQRGDDLVKWKRACVMRDEIKDGAVVNKWRLIRGSARATFELYDFLADRDTNDNIAANNQATVKALTADYESWWKEISPGWEAYPPFVLNTDHEHELTLFAHSWIRGGGSPWHQNHVRNATPGSRLHAIRFDRAGRYLFELRRWPREDGGAIDGPSSSGGGKVIPAKKARINIAGIGKQTAAVKSGSPSVVIEMDVPAGKQTTLATAFLDEEGKVITGAYCVYIRRVGDAAGADSDGNR